MKNTEHSCHGTVFLFRGDRRSNWEGPCFSIWPWFCISLGRYGTAPQPACCQACKVAVLSLKPKDHWLTWHLGTSFAILRCFLIDSPAWKVKTEKPKQGILNTLAASLKKVFPVSFAGMRNSVRIACSIQCYF